MRERILPGVAAAPGVGAGPACVLDAPPASRRRGLARAKDGLETAATELEEIARGLREQGRQAEAEIVETGALMARDPTLWARVEALVSSAGRPAAAALKEAADEMAAQLEALDDRLLAERADDVRSLGRRAAARAAGVRREAASGLLVAESIGPAEVAELAPEVKGIALAGGGLTAHAAIVARSLGVPLVIGLGPALLDVSAGEVIVVDGDRGELVRHPAPARLAAAREAGERRQAARERALAGRAEPAVTSDGRKVRVLANAASPAEVLEALAQGAEGVGLLRTELLFLDSGSWPDARQHARFLEPILAPLAGRTATVRLLDFGGDKTPPFLEGAAGRGVELLLEAPEALEAQLRGILAAAGGVELRILVPMVTSRAQVESVRACLQRAVAGGRMPALGAMIETTAAARAAGELAAVLDFLSLGTNDLTQLVLGLDRERSATAPILHPRVLKLVAATIRAGQAAGIPVEVCGEAASDPTATPLLVGLGADELSVGAARVGEVREWVRALSYQECRAAAERLLGQPVDAAGERV